MSCLKIPHYSFSFLSTPLKRKIRKPGHDAHEPKYFMDGSPTSTSTFDLGCEQGDSLLDENVSLTDSSFADESILASSHQNSTMDFPLSAPSSIARNKILACSTPKDQGQNGETAVKPRPTGMGYESDYKIRSYSPLLLQKCQDKRLLFRNQKIRNLAYTSRAPGEENIRNLYFTRENRPIIEENRRKEQWFESGLTKQQSEARRENWKLLRDNIFEFLLSIFVTMWQVLYAFDVIPNEYILSYCANIAICVIYSIMFMIPFPIWWAVVSCSFMVYVIFVWLFGASCSVLPFLLTAIFAKALTSVTQGVILLVQ